MGLDGASSRVLRGGALELRPERSLGEPHGPEPGNRTTSRASAWPEFSLAAELRSGKRRAEPGHVGQAGGTAEPWGGAQPAAARANPAERVWEAGLRGLI